MQLIFVQVEQRSIVSWDKVIKSDVQMIILSEMQVSAFP